MTVPAFIIRIEEALLRGAGLRFLQKKQQVLFKQLLFLFFKFFLGYNAGIKKFFEGR